MNKQDDIFRAKSSDRIQIINILAAASITILALLLGVSEKPQSSWIVIQLAAAIPLLVTSSMSYAKLGYRHQKELKVWDTLGWYTLSLGYGMMLNAMSLMLFVSNYYLPCMVFISITVVSFLFYNGLDVLLSAKRLKEKGWKFLAYILMIVIGAILPIISGWV
jgi:hypothetical protein